MIRTAPLLALASVLVCGVGCRKGPEAKAAQLRSVEAERQQTLARRLVMAGSSSNQRMPLASWIIPAELREISGIVLTSTGNLLAHDDEVGRIYEINPKSGIILKRFTLKGTPHGDFEAIARAGEDLYLLESNGKLFKFREGADATKVPYLKIDTRLGHECQFEGIAFEPDSSRLLLACKKVSAKSLKDVLVIYRLPLPMTDSTKLTMLQVPMAEVIGVNRWKDFQPSDIAVDPATGNYVLISSQEKGLVVMTPGGKVLRSETLPAGHSQAEGVAVTSDGMLIVSDEAAEKPAHITLYRWVP